MQDHLADGMEDHPRLRDLRAGLRPVSGAEQPERRRHERSGDDPPRAPRLRLHRRADDAAERAAVRPRRAQAGEKVPVRVAGRDAPELRIHRSVRRDPGPEDRDPARQPLRRAAGRPRARSRLPLRSDDGRVRHRGQASAPPLPLGQPRQGPAGDRPVHHLPDGRCLPRYLQDALQRPAAGGLVGRHGSAALRAGPFHRRAHHLQTLPAGLQADRDPARPRRDRP